MILQHYNKVKCLPYTLSCTININFTKKLITVIDMNTI